MRSSGSVARRVGERAAAKGRGEACCGERRFSRAAVGDDRHDAMAAEFFDEVLDLSVAAEEPVGLLLPHRPQADERLVDELDRPVPIRLQHGLEQLLQLLALPERIANALIELGEGRQRARPGAFRGERGNEEKALVRIRARQRDPDFRLDPVHHAFGADIDDEGGRVRDRLFDLRLPLPAGPEIVFVEPHPEADRPRVGAREQPALQFPRRLRIGAGMAQENEGRGLDHARARSLARGRGRVSRSPSFRGRLGGEPGAGLRASPNGGTRRRAICACFLAGNRHPQVELSGCIWVAKGHRRPGCRRPSRPPTYNGCCGVSLPRVSAHPADRSCSPVSG